MKKNLACYKYLYNNNLKNESSNPCRILIINPYPIGADCPIGIMMENLMGEYDPADVLQYYTNTCEIRDNIKFKSEQITLTNSILTKLKIVIKTTIKKFRSNNCKFEDKVDLYLRNTGFRSSQLMAWKFFLIPVDIDKKLLNTIKRFNPTIIYTQGYSYTMLKYVNKLSKKLSCPVVIHTLDDWMETQYKRGLLSAIPFYKFTSLFKTMLNNGENHMVASPAMIKHMSDMYGGKYEFVMNCCEYLGYEIKSKRKSLKIVYAGGLTLERYATLNEIAKCINDINDNKKIFELHIYAPSSHINVYKSMMVNSVFFHNNIKHEEVCKILTDSDILIHAESFNPNVVRFTRYSLSTKIPECLASGRPLLYMGPLYIGVAKFLIDNEIGICVDNIDDFKEKLLLLHQNDNYYMEVAQGGYTKGHTIFETSSMRKTMGDCLIGRRKQ